MEQLQTKSWRSSLAVTAVFSIIFAVAIISCNKKSDSVKTELGKDSANKSGAMASAERGKYLVTIVGCNDCHTPWTMGEHGPGPDMARMLSGHPAEMKLPPPPKPMGPWMVSAAATQTAWAGPWGVSYTANLTPDSATGIGKWDETTFMLAIRNGKHIGTGRDILPPMPWPAFKQMTDEDLKSVYAFLRTIPAIHNQVPDPIINMPPPGAPMADAPKK
ncbi:MAG: diheme cytochrome c-553 [bacterium]